ARADERDDRERRSQHACQRENPVRPLQKHPADAEQAGGHVRRYRGHPLPRKPRGSPLRECPPRALGMAEVGRRGQQSTRDERQRQSERDKPERRRLRNPPERPQQPQPAEQPVAGPRCRREEDDRIGGMHDGSAVRKNRSSRALCPGSTSPQAREQAAQWIPVTSTGMTGDVLGPRARRYRDSILSAHAKKRVAIESSSPPFAVALFVAVTVVASRRGRGGRYLFTGL